MFPRNSDGRELLLLSRAVRDDVPGGGVDFRSTSSEFLGLIIDPTNAISEENQAGTAEQNNVNQANGLDKDDITYFPWDMNGSGAVTPTDAGFVINRLGQFVTPDNARADLNGNGAVTPTDAGAVINRIGYLRNDSVIETNHAPVLSPIANQTIDAGSELFVTATATATDPERLTDNLTFRLADGAPAGATIDASTGVFGWTPVETGRFEIGVVVTDSSGLADQQFFSVRVFVNQLEEVAAGAVNFLRATVHPTTGLPRNEATLQELASPPGTLDPNHAFFNPAQLGNLFTTLVLGHAWHEQSNGRFLEGFSDIELLGGLDRATMSLQNILDNHAFETNGVKALFKTHQTDDGQFVGDREIALLDHSQLFAGLEVTANYLRSLDPSSLDGVDPQAVSELANRIDAASAEFNTLIWFDGTNLHLGEPDNPLGDSVVDRITSESRLASVAGFARNELTEASFRNIIVASMNASASGTTPGGTFVEHLPFFGTALEIWAATPYLSVELGTRFDQQTLLPLVDAHIERSAAIGLPAAGATGVATGLDDPAFRPFALSPTESNHSDRDLPVLIPPAAGMMAGASGAANPAAISNLAAVIAALRTAGRLDPVFGLPNYLEFPQLQTEQLVDPAKSVRGTLELEQMAVGLLNQLLGGDFLDRQLRQDAGWNTALDVYAELLNPVTIQSFSPANGEEMVNLTRETVVRFNGPIDPATVTPDSFYLIANGQRLPGRILVSSTERFVTFFYETPLPPSTAVRVFIDGGLIRGRNGFALDADADGGPGGQATTDFRTLPLTRIPGTNLFLNFDRSFSQVSF